MITKVFGHDTRGRSTEELVEHSWRVHKFKSYLEVTKNRKRDLIQFWDNRGKLHTVNAEDIVL